MENFILQRKNGLIYTHVKAFSTPEQAKQYLSQNKQPNTEYRIFDVEKSRRENDALLATVDWANITCDDICRAIETAFSALDDNLRVELCKSLSDELAWGL